MAVGTAKMRRKKFGLIRTTDLGRKSANTRITIVVITVWMMKISTSEGIRFLNHDSIRSAASILNMTVAMLTPISMVDIYRPGLREKRAIMPDPKFPCLRSSSIRSLLEAMNASSIAEKNAARRIAKGIMTHGFMPQIYSFFR